MLLLGALGDGAASCSLLPALPAPAPCCCRAALSNVCACARSLYIARSVPFRGTHLFGRQGRDGTLAACPARSSPYLLPFVIPRRRLSGVTLHVTGRRSCCAESWRSGAAAAVRSESSAPGAWGGGIHTFCTESELKRLTCYTYVIHVFQGATPVASPCSRWTPSPIEDCNSEGGDTEIFA